MSPSRRDPPLPDKPTDGFPKHLTRDSQAAVADSFDAATIDQASVTGSLVKSGDCILRNVASLENLALIKKDVRPWILKDQPWQGDLSLVCLCMDWGILHEEGFSGFGETRTWGGECGGRCVASCYRQGEDRVRIHLLSEGRYLLRGMRTCLHILSATRLQGTVKVCTPSRQPAGFIKTEYR
ncbi:hypothetical protein BDZ45DRAFT_751811 [Acephala macrosclerotiorum]|nr:hypothetical protein BDZ45DRAFT_751811 [Acephala macrosclerotiorum]